jgi:hypothetical protein
VSKFLVLYRAPISARQQLESSTPEQRQAGMELWQAWSSNAGSAIVDLGAPLGDGILVGDGESYNDIAGYSILEADSEQALVGLLRDHPHFHAPGGQIEAHEMQTPPGR